MAKRLYRSNNDIMISGVCAGVAEYFDIDPTIIRIATALLTVASFSSLIVVYIICMIVIPTRPINYQYDKDIYDADSDYDPSERQKKTKTLIGVGLIAAGGYLLMENYIWWFDKFSFWSLGLIALGVLLIIAPRHKTDNSK